MIADFSGIFLPIILSLIVATISYLLFYYFKRSSDKSCENYRNNQNNLNTKKKIKKKINQLKSIKSEKNEINISEDLLEKNREKDLIKHIEIKSNPEIINNEIHKNLNINRNLIQIKPILRKTDEEILINKLDCPENVWTKIPKDEVEILRHSRHSSVASDFRINSKEDELRAESKLSRGQKKRLKAKLKSIDYRQNETKNDNQNNNNSSNFSDDDKYDDRVDLDHHEEDISKLRKNQNVGTLKQLKPESLSTNSSQISDKVQSFSSTENDERLFMGDFVEDLETNTLEKGTDESMNNYNFNSFVDEYKNTEEKLKLEQEVKELKNERYNLMQKINDFSSMTSNVLALKKDNELYAKKYDDLERTCNAMKKELTSSIQKQASTEGQMVRFKSERNQQLNFYENEISKLNNKVNILENDIRTKVAEQESLKNNIDKLHHMMTEKDKCMQNQSMEVSSMKEQLYKKRMDCQDLEAQIKNVNLKLKEMESQKHSAYEDTQSLNAQLEMLRKEKNNIQKEFEKFIRDTKTQERSQDSIIASFQYQLDDFRREQQQSLLCNNEDKEDKILKKHGNSITNSQDSIIPEGYQLIESDTIKKFTNLINESNQKLQEKCDQYNAIINDYKERENNLIQQNSLLNKNYSKLNSEFESHLTEVVSLRQCTERLQQELSKNSEINVEDFKVELDEKCEALRKTEEILSKLELSVSEEEVKWRDCLNETRNENVKLENELKSQGMLVSNQNKKIIELTNLLQSYNHSQNEAMFNGTLSVDFAETSGQ